MLTAVTIVGPKYRGVLLEARTGGGLNALGTWQRPPPDTKFLQVHFSVKPMLKPELQIVIMLLQMPKVQ